MNVEFHSHGDEIRAAMKESVARALEMCGLKAEGYAKALAPVDTGRLRNSISHAVSGNDVFIGTNAAYAAYVELGTGKYYPGGRQTPWAYQDEKGNWHRTSGQKERPFLKPAVADHGDTYKNIINAELKGK